MAFKLLGVRLLAVTLLPYVYGQEAGLPTPWRTGIASESCMIFVEFAIDQQPMLRFQVNDFAANYGGNADGLDPNSPSFGTNVVSFQASAACLL